MTDIKIDTKKFEKELEKAGKDIKKTINQAIKKTVFDAEAELKARTPVDIGTAQGAWKTTPTEDYYIISNNIDYIERLNNGYSKQAPANFVQHALNFVLDKFKRIFK